jgi:hypothetical protein
MLHWLLVLSRFSPYLRVYCIFRCYILLLHDYFHFPFPLHFWSSSPFFFQCPGQYLLRPSVISQHNIRPYHFNMLFSILFRIVCLTFIFSLDYFISYLDCETIKMVVLRRTGTLWRNKFIWCEQVKIFLPFIPLAIIMWFPRNLPVNIDYYCLAI